MNFGLVFEDGILKGFKMPEHDVHKKQFAERGLKQKLTKEQLRYADHALEFRARWLHESVGYGDSSCNIKESDRMPAGSNIPIGCEIPEVVAKAIHALDEMKKINKTHKQYVFLLNEVYLARKDNERIADVIKEKGYSADQYRAARNRFAYFLVNC